MAGVQDGAPRGAAWLTTTGEAALAEAERVLHPWTEEERLRAAESTATTLARLIPDQSEHDQLVIAAAVHETLRLHMGGETNSGELTTFQRAVAAEAFLVAAHAADPLTLAQQRAHLVAARNALEAVRPNAREGAGSTAAALEAAANALIDMLQPSDAVLTEATRAAREALESVIPLSVTEQAERTEAATVAALVAASTDAERLNAAQRALLRIKSSNSRAATLEQAMAAQEATLTTRDERIVELERMLREMVVVHGRTLTLDAATAEVHKRMPEHATVGNVTHAYAMAQAVLDWLHARLGLNCYLAVEAFADVIAAEEASAERGGGAPTAAALGTRALEYVRAADLIRDSFLRRRLDPASCVVSYRVLGANTPEVRRNVEGDATVHVWGGTRARSGDFGAWPVRVETAASLSRCAGVLGADSLTRQSPQGLCPMEERLMELVARGTGAALHTVAERQQREAATCFALARSTTRTWAERTVKTAELTRIRDYLERMLDGDEDLAMAREEVESRTTPDARVLATCLSLLLLTRRTDACDRYTLAEGGLRIPTAVADRRRRWADVLQPALRELLDEGLPAALRGATLKGRGAAQAQKDAVAIMSDYSVSVSATRSVILRVLWPWVNAVAALADLSRQQRAHTADKSRLEAPVAAEPTLGSIAPRRNVVQPTADSVKIVLGVAPLSPVRDVSPTRAAFGARGDADGGMPPPPATSPVSAQKRGKGGDGDGDGMAAELHAMLGELPSSPAVFGKVGTLSGMLAQTEASAADRMAAEIRQTLNYTLEQPPSDPAERSQQSSQPPRDRPSPTLTPPS